MSQLCFHFHADVNNYVCLSFPESTQLVSFQTSCNTCIASAKPLTELTRLIGPYYEVRVAYSLIVHEGRFAECGLKPGRSELSVQSRAWGRVSSRIGSRVRAAGFFVCDVRSFWLQPPEWLTRSRAVGILTPQALAESGQNTTQSWSNNRHLEWIHRERLLNSDSDVTWHLLIYSMSANLCSACTQKKICLCPLAFVIMTPVGVDVLIDLDAVADKINWNVQRGKTQQTRSPFRTEAWHHCRPARSDRITQYLIISG